MARTVYVSTELQGGGSGLDGVNGNVLVKGDLAFYINKHTTGAATKHGFLSGIYMASSRGSTVAYGSTEDQPNFIVPDSNGTDWIWGLTQPLTPTFHTTGLTAILPNYGVSIIRTQTPTVHQLKRPRRGAVKKLVFATTGAVKVRLTTAALAIQVRLMHTGAVAGSSWSVISAPTSRALLKTPASIELIGKSTSRWEISGICSPGTGTAKKNFTFSSST